MSVLDSFFASVEIRDKPSLANKPVAVGGHPNARGVISTSNYIARKYGVHSAIATAKALINQTIANSDSQEFRDVVSNLTPIDLQQRLQ